MNTVCNWLSERIDHSLHDVQLVALTNIMPKIYADMSLQGVTEDKLNLKSYQTIMSRLKMEEASAMAGGSLFEQPTSSTSIFSTSILSSLTSSSSQNSSSQASSAIISQQHHNLSSSSNNNPTSTTTLPSHLLQNSSSSSCAPSFATGSGTAMSHRQQPPSANNMNNMTSGSSMLSSSGRQADQQLQFGRRPISNFNANNENPNLATGEQQEAENIADRAFQSATRMFKGFWAS